MASQTVSSLALVLIFLISFSQGNEFWLEGSQNTWKIPSVADEFTKWAHKLRFRIGDAIVVNYDPKSDSILEVNEADHKKCNKVNPIKKYEDGNTTISLNRSGWFYFISGADGHCEKGQRLAVDVLSAKHSNYSSTPSPSSTTTLSSPLVEAPAPAPSSAAHALKITTPFLVSFSFLFSCFIGLGMM